MKTSRRGLFGLVAGALGAALLGKEAKPEKPPVWGIVQTNIPNGMYAAGFQSSSTSPSSTSVTWHTFRVVGHHNVRRTDLYYTDLKDTT